jgi:hypothetical protein
MKRRSPHGRNTIDKPAILIRQVDSFLCLVCTLLRLIRALLRLICSLLRLIGGLLRLIGGLLRLIHAVLRLVDGPLGGSSGFLLVLALLLLFDRLVSTRIWRVVGACDWGPEEERKRDNG